MGRRIFAATTACLLAGTAFSGSTPLRDIPLKWTPTNSLAEMGPLDVSGPLLTTSVHVDDFVDTRQNPATVAENREKPANVRPVTTSTDVASYFTEHLRDSMKAAGLNVVDGAADVTVRGEIREFFVTESDLYRGNLSLLVSVKNGEGKELWSGVIGGGAEHFGRSYRADNYYETISDMVLRASYNLLANPGFHDSLKTH
jgi:Uncharacterized lipoprotein/Lipopolysaccharide-assembly